MAQVESSELEKLRRQIESLDQIKNQHKVRTEENNSSFNQNMERKAMLNEEIRAKLVQRADDVAQQEELENYLG